jgi:glycosyltransferase involved in cell wall biosynthesis
MSQPPLVSSVINNHDYARFLGAAIESALQQTYGPLEVIVVDDGSTDESRDVIADYGDKVVPLFKANGGQDSAVIPGMRLRSGTADSYLSTLAPLFGRIGRIEKPQGAYRLHGGKVPFLERDGQYWGPPPDDRSGIAELERLRRAGAGFLVLAWPAFWWLDHDPAFRQHLAGRYRCVLQNERIVTFALGSAPAA